jgi:hypothetical protein
MSAAPQEQAARVVAATQRPVEPQAMQLLELPILAAAAALRLVLDRRQALLAQAAPAS